MENCNDTAHSKLLEEVSELAMCLKHLGSPEEAEGLLKSAISRFSGSLKSDKYLLPYATLEYGLILRDRGETAKALEQLERAK